MNQVSKKRLRFTDREVLGQNPIENPTAWAIIYAKVRLTLLTLVHVKIRTFKSFKISFSLTILYLRNNTMRMLTITETLIKVRKIRGLKTPYCCNLA